MRTTRGTSTDTRTGFLGIRAVVQQIEIGPRISRLSSACRQRRAAGQGADFGDIVPCVNTPVLGIVNVGPLRRHLRSCNTFGTRVFAAVVQEIENKGPAAGLELIKRIRVQIETSGPRCLPKACGFGRSLAPGRNATVGDLCIQSLLRQFESPAAEGERARILFTKRLHSPLGHAHRNGASNSFR